MLNLCIHYKRINVNFKIEKLPNINHQPKTVLYLSIFNWQLTKQFKGVHCPNFFFRRFLFFARAARFFLCQSFWAGTLTQDWYTVLFVDMLRSLCLTGPGSSPLSRSPRVVPLSLLFIQSPMRKRSLIFGWIHRIWRNCCFCVNCHYFHACFLGATWFVWY